MWTFVQTGQEHVVEKSYNLINQSVLLLWPYYVLWALSLVNSELFLQISSNKVIHMAYFMYNPVNDIP